MSTPVVPAVSAWARPLGTHGAWWVALAALAALVAPVWWEAAHGLWHTEEHGHGPLIAAVVVWLFWSVRKAIDAAPYRPARVAGWTLFGLGLVIYVLGRAFDISIFEFAAQIPLVAGGLLLMRGPDALRIAWFGVFYLLFMVPLPGTFVDAVTGSLKSSISVIVQQVLYAAGYPIAHTGVILTVGQYQLLVADACSGLNSMFSLFALGTLYMYVAGRRSWVHNAVMLASIAPIAFLANIVRVIILVLVTYHLGDEAGQGFLHGAAGMALMGVALLAFAALDGALALVLRRR